MAHSLDLDRIAPTRRPDGDPAGFQTWRNLLFVHWALPPEVIRERVPKSLKLDLWDGQAHVGVVPFEMKDIRSTWMPELAALDFLETNVRTYVHYKGEPGVYFFSLEASSWLAVRVARLVWGLPYFHAEMSCQNGTYRSVRKGSGEMLEADWTVGKSIVPALGSYEHFVLERYLLFSERALSKGQSGLRKGQVHHVPYPAKGVTLSHMKQTLFPDATGAPYAAHFSPGVDVEVFGPWPIE
jgi:uncharacterized protein YqjF (DUF2071 family)